MPCRSILGGALAAILFSVGAAHAASASPSSPAAAVGALPFLQLPGVFGSKGRSEEVQLAQASDPRVVALEEQIRSLNGTVEELNFQILQLQEQIRKMQEDNEFRFQELEKRSDARGGTPPDATTRTDRTTAGADPASPTVEDVIAGDQTNATDQGTGAPPKTFGTITVDENGNVKSVDTPTAADALPPAVATEGPPTSGGSVVAALPPTNDPEELYRNSYQFILSGDYATAETGFRDHIARFPQSANASDANFWLGEALLGQRKYRDAAETFLAASKQYPKAKKAPDMLLKLGVSLAGLNQREVACATFVEVGKRYPNASTALKERVKQEQARAAC